MTLAELESLQALTTLAEIIERLQTMNVVTPEERTAAYTILQTKIATEFNTLLA